MNDNSRKSTDDGDLDPVEGDKLESDFSAKDYPGHSLDLSPDLSIDDHLLTTDAIERSAAGDFDEEMEDLQAGRKPRKRIGLFCFGCNRQEGHFLSQENRWFYSFLTGMTFGLICLIGPYRCQCCGSSRLMCTDKSNPRFMLINGSKKKKSRRKRRDDKF